MRPADDPEIDHIPADLPDGIAVTVNVAPAEIPAGDTITVSGQGAPGSGQVRLAAVTDGMTLGIQDVTVGADGSYTAAVPVEATYPPGPVQICALTMAQENAEITCTDLLITPPAPGSVRGQLPLGDVTTAEAAVLDAEFRLMDAAGTQLYRERDTGQRFVFVGRCCPWRLRICGHRTGTQRD